jgi:hypothetical protein
MQAASMLTMVLGAYTAYKGAKTSASYQEAAGQTGYRVAEENAALLRAEGAIEADEYRREAKKLLGAQRARYAASGVALTGTPLDVMAESVETSELNALRIAFSAERAARLEEQKGQAILAQGISGGQATRSRAQASLLTTLGQAAMAAGTPRMPTLNAPGSTQISTSAPVTGVNMNFRSFGNVA